MNFLVFMLLPECKEYWQFFLCQGVLFGTGIAITYPPHSWIMLILVSSHRWDV